MSKFLGWFLAIFLLSSFSAFADTMPNPYVLSVWNRCSSMITTGGASQTAISATANSGSKTWIIENPSTAAGEGIGSTEELWVDLGETSGVTSFDLPPGTSLSLGGQAVWQGSVTVYAATTGHIFICFYGQ